MTGLGIELRRRSIATPLTVSIPVEAFVRAALEGTRTSRRHVQLVSALLDLTTFRSLERRGFDARAAAITMARAAGCALRPDARKGGGGTR